MRRAKGNVGAQIIEALGEAIADMRGEATGIRKHVVRVPTDVDVKAIRRRLDMSQGQFAKIFGFSLGTVQNWERGHRRPKGAARALLTVVAERPDAVISALSLSSASHLSDTARITRSSIGPQTAAVRPFKYDDHATGQKIAMSVSPYYTTLRIGDREYYFLPETGEFDGAATCVER